MNASTPTRGHPSVSDTTSAESRENSLNSQLSGTKLWADRCTPIPVARHASNTFNPQLPMQEAVLVGALVGDANGDDKLSYQNNFVVLLDFRFV
jgi:hypothetical protein